MTKVNSSVVVAVDGPAECGKTTFIDNVAAEARYQHQVLRDRIDVVSAKFVDVERSTGIMAWYNGLNFNQITRISAGNAFRAAVHHVRLEESAGRGKYEFDEEDMLTIKGILASDGIEEILQHDPEIKNRVSTVARMTGVIALCETVFCQQVSDAYFADGGGNLVIADARNPIGTFQRNGILGTEAGKIVPATIIPIYIDTPIVDAAARMPGDFQAHVNRITDRREKDATRRQHPVVVPGNLLDNHCEWRNQFGNLEAGDIAAPYRLNNGLSTSLEDIQYEAGIVATVASDVAILNGLRNTELAAPSN